MDPEVLRTKLLAKIDAALSHAVLVSGDNRSMLLALRGYAVAMTKDDLAKLATFYPASAAPEATTAKRPHPLLPYFAHAHLSPQLRSAAKPFSDLADLVAGAEVTNEEERTVALRKLLEAKDCFVRSCLMVNVPRSDGQSSTSPGG